MIDKGLVEPLDGLFGPDSGWAVAGHAANVYRLESRFTEDVALLVSLGSRSMGDAASGLTKQGWTVRVMMSDGWLLRVSHPDFGYMYVVATETRYQERGAAPFARRRSRGEVVSARAVRRRGDSPQTHRQPGEGRRRRGGHPPGRSLT